MANILTPKFRASYPNVFKKKLNDLSKKEEYSLVAVFPKGTDLSGLKKAAKEACFERFGADPKKWPKNLRDPFRSNDEKATEDDTTGKKAYPDGYEEGGFFINLKSQEKPGLVNGKNEDIITESDFYAGCYARATVSAYAYGGKDTGFTPGVAFGLRNIQKMAEGEPLGSRTRAQDDFEPIADAGEPNQGGNAESLFG